MAGPPRQPTAPHAGQWPKRPRIECANSLPWPDRCRFGLSEEETRLWLAQQRLAAATRTPPIFAAALFATTALVATLLWLGRPQPAAPASDAKWVPVAASVHPKTVAAPNLPPQFSAQRGSLSVSRPSPL